MASLIFLESKKLLTQQYQQLNDGNSVSFYFRFYLPFTVSASRALSLAFSISRSKAKLKEETLILNIKFPRREKTLCLLHHL